MGKKKLTDTKNRQKAKKRTAGMKAIDPALDLGNGLSVASLETAITNLGALIETYNTTLTKCDELTNQIKAGDKALGDLVERALSGVAAKFGKDSDEYEKAGGTRKSERKKRAKKPAPVA